MTWTSSELLNQFQLQKVYLLRSTGEVEGWGMATTCDYFGPVIACDAFGFSWGIPSMASYNKYIIIMIIIMIIIIIISIYIYI